jgi:hypothetical protein
MNLKGLQSAAAGNVDKTLVQSAAKHHMRKGER